LDESRFEAALHELEAVDDEVARQQLDDGEGAIGFVSGHLDIN
jgi:hypothetical protein